MQKVLKITLNTLPAPRTHALDVPRYSKMPLPQPLHQEEDDFGSRFSNLHRTPTSPTLLGTWNTGTYWFLPCLGTESKYVKGDTEEIRLCWWWLCGRHCIRQNEPLQEGTMTLGLFPYGDILSCVEEESDHTKRKVIILMITFLIIKQSQLLQPLSSQISSRNGLLVPTGIQRIPVMFENNNLQVSEW